MLRIPDLTLIARSDAGSDIDSRTPKAQRRSIISVNASSCRWPIGDPRSAGFYLCGGATDGKATYCARHTKLAVRPASTPIPKWKIA